MSSKTTARLPVYSSIGETSSIVSRKPPFSVSTSHSNERRWISMRFGSSSEVPRRAKLRRWRGASTGAKTAAPSERSGEGKAGARARPAKIAQRRTPLGGAWIGRHGPRPEAPRICGGALPEGRLRLLAERKITRNCRFRQRFRHDGGQVELRGDRSTRR